MVALLEGTACHLEDTEVDRPVDTVVAHPAYLEGTRSRPGLAVGVLRMVAAGTARVAYLPCLLKDTFLAGTAFDQPWATAVGANSEVGTGRWEVAVQSTDRTQAETEEEPHHIEASADCFCFPYLLNLF